MADNYTVTITYTGNGTPTTLTVHSDGSLDSLAGPTLINAAAILGDLTRLAVWLSKNGGAKIEIEEEGD